MTTADDFASYTINNHERRLAESMVLLADLEDVDPIPALFSPSASGRARSRLVRRIIDPYIKTHKRYFSSNVNSRAREVHGFATLRSETSI